MSDRLITSFERRSIAMVLSVMSMAAGGVAFNAIAARTMSPDRLGLYASLFFWMALVNNVTAIGLPAVISRLPRYDPMLATAITSRAFIATSVTSILGAVPLVLLASRLLRSELADELDRWPIVVTTSIVCVLAVGMALSVLVEIRMVALGMYRLTVGRAVITNMIRCALVAVPYFRSRTVLTLVASIGITALSGIVGAVLLVAHGHRHLSSVSFERQQIAPELRAAIANWLATLALVAAQYAYPVLTNLSPAENASFFLAWQMMGVVFLVSSNIGVALTIDASPAGASAPLQRALTLSLAIAASAPIAAVLLARPIEATLFTERYRDATRVLPVLLAAAVPWAVIAVLLAAARADGRHGAVIAMSLGFGISIALAVAVTRADAPGDAAAAWVGATLVAMVVSIVVDQASRRHRLH